MGSVGTVSSYKNDLSAERGSGKYHWHEDTASWEMTTKTQEYRGYTIDTVMSHGDWLNAPRHREYRIVNPDGTIQYFGIDKRGGNLQSLKEVIDREIERRSR